MVQRGMTLVRVETSAGAYDVRVEVGALERAGRFIAAALGQRKIFVVADEAVWACQGERLAAGLKGADWTLLSIPLGETRKRLATVEELCQAMHRNRADRRSVIVAFGGGVAGDVGGFVAASYMRGVDVVQVPTTLLAQVDAAVGGKTGVNLASGKNLVGAFHQPALVLIDPRTLESLPEREYRAGLQEVVKHGVIRSPELFEYMERHREAVLGRRPEAVEYMISASVQIKAAVVREDEREGGLRRILNFGHTLGHALEAETAYSRLLHGEAVGFGLVAAAKLSELRGRLSARGRQRIEATVLAYVPELPLDDLDPSRIVARIAGDKKAFGGRPRFVLAEAIGKVSEELDPPSTQVLEATAYALRAWLVRETQVV